MVEKTQKQQFEVVLLGNQYLNEAVNLLNHTFCTENPVWKHFVQDEKQTFQYVTDITKQSLKNNMLYAIIGKQNKKIRSVLLYLDMVDYVNLTKTFKEKYGHLKLVSQLASYSQQLQSEIRSKQYQRGYATFGLMVSTDSQFFKANYASFLLSLVLTDLRDRCYKITYGRCSNQLSRIALQRLGGKVINSVKVRDTDLTFYLMQNDHQKYEINQKINKMWDGVGFNFKSKL